MKSLAEVIHPILPRWLHRVSLRLARGLQQLWRRLHYRPSEGCAVIVQNEQGEVLLVRHSYVEPETWMLPSGKMKRRELPLAAAEREMHEEVNCRLSSVELIEFEETEWWGRRHTTFIVGAVCGAAPDPDLREIEEAAFFPPADLPLSTSEPTRARLERWLARVSLPYRVPPFVRPEYVRARTIG